MCMLALSWPAPLDLSVVRTVAFGLAALGAVAGVIGTFAVVRRQSLQGDAISHAALPGVALAFLFGGREPAELVTGAAVAGWVAMSLVGGIVRRSRVPFDAALAGALAVFFGFGLVLMTYLQKLAGRPAANAFERWVKPHAGESVGHGLDRYLFGQAALLREDDVWLLAGLGGAAVLVAVLFWKEFKLVSFDRDFAASLGYPTRVLDLLLTTLVVVAVVIGLRSVGVVLMSALLVAPATAARQWTNRLGTLAALAAAFGATAGFAGVLVSHELGAGGRAVPTGPTVVLGATALVVVSLLVGSKRRLLHSPRLWGQRARGAGTASAASPPHP
jgi:manganese/zinc/iron transport system permease protein